jgi:adenosine deaminase
MAPRTLTEFIHSLPKTEIHIHAEATVSFDSYFALNRKYGMDPSLKSPKDFRRFLEMDSLGAMIKNFLYLQGLFRAPEDFALIVPDVEAYAVRNNIRYMETFVAPSMVLRQGGIDFDGIVDPLVEGFDRLASMGGPDVRILIDVSRSFGPENAMRNVDHVIDYLSRRHSDRVIGIGLGGQESGNPCGPYKNVFKKAKEAGLHRVAHAGEEVGPESIRDAIVELGAERIGHGTSAIQDPAIMDMLAERKVPIEICPASNVITGKYVKRYEDHPMKAYFERGMFVTLNTDDPVLFDVELNEEYRRVSEKLAFDRAGIVKLLENNIRATFMGAAGKKAALARLEADSVAEGVRSAKS